MPWAGSLWWSNILLTSDLLLDYEWTRQSFNIRTGTTRGEGSCWFCSHSICHCPGYNGRGGRVSSSTILTSINPVDECWPAVSESDWSSPTRWSRSPSCLPSPLVSPHSNLSRRFLLFFPLWNAVEALYVSVTGGGAGLVVQITWYFPI